ncbi:hypothetical protein GCM10023331_16660 [Algivirga pacifica]|uniref:DUF4296 domain-containing protein n=2 Tax=Algivirga pacifica TaxID=1162670 RepID=A0ABP9D6I8_9BACT
MLSGCSSEQKPAPPAELISKEKMAAIITDMYMLEATVAARGVKKDQGVALYATLRDSLYQEHALDTAVYRQSYTYYLEDGESMKAIYEMVTDTLNQRKEKAEKSRVKMQ